MSEILPPNGDQIGVEAYIGFLMQADMSEGAVSNEASDYQNILARWRNKEITDADAKQQAAEVSNARGANVH